MPRVRYDVLLLLVAFWFGVWLLYNILVRPRCNMLQYNMNMQAPIGLLTMGAYNRTTNEPSRHLNGWLLGHVAIYFTIGMVFRGQFGLILALSLACEAYEHAVGFDARYVLDPLINLLAYAAGHMVDGTAYIPQRPLPAGLLLLLVALIACLNHPRVLECMGAGPSPTPHRDLGPIRCS